MIADPRHFLYRTLDPDGAKRLAAKHLSAHDGGELYLQYSAREAFLTSASQVVLPVVRIDGRSIGNGVPGSIATALRAKFHDHAAWS